MLTKLEFSQQMFEKSSNTIFHETPSSGSRVVPCGRTDTRQLIVSFRNAAKAPKNKWMLFTRKQDENWVMS